MQKNWLWIAVAPLAVVVIILIFKTIAPAMPDISGLIGSGSSTRSEIVVDGPRCNGTKTFAVTGYQPGRADCMAHWGITDDSPTKSIQVVLPDGTTNTVYAGEEGLVTYPIIGWKPDGGEVWIQVAYHS